MESLKENWSIVTTIIAAMWIVYQYVSGSVHRKAATAKTNMDILVAMNNSLRQENVDLRSNKSEILKANTELIAMNRELIKKNEEFSTRIKALETEVKGLQTKLIKTNMLKED
jgi:cell division protein FtsB